MNDAPIVSHVASQEYRANVDSMTCAVPGCKRWRVDDKTKFCQDCISRHAKPCYAKPGEFVQSKARQVLP